MRKYLKKAVLIWFFLLAVRPLLPQTLKGIVEKRSFMGPVTGKKIEFSIYLPENYYSTDEKYPVIYHLHGLGGSHEGNHTRIVPASFEKAKEQGVIGPVIIVFPDGYRDSFWGDSFDGNKPAETNIIYELIPYVDSNFRTLSSPKFRAIQGFSMGGFGAAKFLTKFPDLFNAAIIYDGAMLNWEILAIAQALIASTIFANNEAYFNEFSPWFQAEKNKIKLKSRTRVRMVVGALVTWNRNFLSYLNELAIPVEYVETPCLHDLSCLLNYEGLSSASFLADCFHPFFRNQKEFKNK
ncbi:MAG: alpha/beta hydrolase-fold protein [Candidatus Aminicenantes bacterium]|nr:alpha/beta hydrolase-fold protein [Candidatus Aminicenantes bacterium]